MPQRSYHINFVGDVMLGRKIDQLFPTHATDPDTARLVDGLIKNDPSLRDYNHESPWGNTLNLLHSADLNFINLENAVTTHEKPYEGKKYHFRMHPANLVALKLAKIDYANLANNHTLDFSRQGLKDSVKAVRDIGIAFAGAGLTPEERLEPAHLRLPTSEESHAKPNVWVWAASDNCPEPWVSAPEFNLLDYSQQALAQVKSTLMAESARISMSPGHLRIFSVHWGPNYAWQPAPEIVSFAHFLIDECSIDIVHGHSSHHVQGVELYKGKLIIYGMGDFVEEFDPDDGCEEYRSKLSGIFRVKVASHVKSGSLKLDKLEIFPTRIESFRATLLKLDDPDHAWVREKISQFSSHFNTRPLEELGDQGQLIFDLQHASRPSSLVTWTATTVSQMAVSLFQTLAATFAQAKLYFYRLVKEGW